MEVGQGVSRGIHPGVIITMLVVLGFFCQSKREQLRSEAFAERNRTGLIDGPQRPHQHSLKRRAQPEDAIGVFQRGESAADVLGRYTILSIGDGLVSQVPSLIFSTAAAASVEP